MVSPLVLALLAGAPNVSAPAPVAPALQEDAADSSAASPADDAAARAAREAAFSELLTNAQLVGFFTMRGQGSDLAEDSYTLTRVTKKEGDLWTFEAKVEYGRTAIPIKIDLPVKWAGDTPVISVDEMSFPLLGTYSARVLFHDGEYAGTWSGDGYGGQMFGRVVPVEDEAAPASGDQENGVDGGQAALTPGGWGPADPEEDTNWPSFRGWYGRGVAEGHTTAIEWDVESGENILFRVPVPGLAHSSPVIWGDDVFLTTAVRKGGEQELRVGLYGDIAPVQDESEFLFEVHAYDKESGELKWAQLAWEGVPDVKRHPKGSHAAATPATDGERVVAFFGSEGLHCFSVEGEPLWSRDLGRMDSGYFMVPDAQWGFAASPVLYDDRVIVQCDIQGDSFVAVLDANTGETLWKTMREEVPTWSTPTVDVRDGRAQVICNGWKHIGGYDLETGEELWRMEGGGDIPVPTPVVAHDLIYITNAHGRLAPIYALDVAAEGELTRESGPDDGLAWSNRRGIYMQTPVVYGDNVYFCSDSGILGCYDARTGEEVYRERLGAGRSGFTGSGIAADGKLYFTSEEGDVHVVDGWRFDVLAVNALGEECMSSPAVSEGVLYYRTRGHLVAVGME